MFNNTPTCSTTHQHVHQHTNMFNNTPTCSTTHQHVQQHTNMFNNTPRCSTTHQDVQQHANMFNNTPTCSTTHQDVQQHTKMFNNTPTCSTTHLQLHSREGMEGDRVVDLQCLVLKSNNDRVVVVLSSFSLTQASCHTVLDRKSLHDWKWLLQNTNL
ncbi:hypothetical protein BgiMline_026580 [Biomphalaria glabrata]|nr:hypothetical protein BgiMline_021046 [Biomphalaria glabrata]